MKKAIITLIAALAIRGCAVIKPVPIETGTTVHVIDSVAIHYLDSIRIYEATRYRDFAWMNDTLKLSGSRSRAWAVCDTLKGAITGELEEDPDEEKTRIVYKDKIVYKDSIRFEEKPVPVEVVKEKKVYPKWMIILSILGVVSTLVLGFIGYLKIKKKGF